MKHKKVLAILLLLAGIYSCSKKENEAAKPDSSIQKPEEQVVEQKQSTFDSLKTTTEAQPLAQSRQQPIQVLQQPDGKYTIQVSAWRTHQKAEREAQKLRLQNLQVSIEQVNLPEKGGIWYRVRVGHFQSKAAALEFWQRQNSTLAQENIWIDFARK